MTTVALEYECDGGIQPTANFVTAVSAVNVNEGELSLLGMGVQADVTAELPNTNTVRRTITLLVLPTCPFSTDDEYKDATRNLWTDKFALRVPARVTAAEPVVTP